MDLPACYTARPATHDDVRAIYELVIAMDVADYGEPDYDESDVVDDFARDRFDLARDTWVVDAPDGSMAACGNAWDKRPHELVIAELGVHPDEVDLYPWLVERVSERAREHAAESGRTVAHVYNSEPNRRRAAALVNAGYEICRVFRRMEVPLDAVRPAPSKPGVSVRAFTPDDAETVWRVLSESFAEHYDYVPQPYESWRRIYVESDSYRPEHWYVAEAGGEVAGVLVGQAHEDKGWVKSVGTLPAARGRGVGSALLLAAFDGFRTAGFAKAALGVDSDNSTGAMALYERLGMTATQRYDLYERVFTRS